VKKIEIIKSVETWERVGCEVTEDVVEGRKEDEMEDAKWC